VGAGGEGDSIEDAVLAQNHAPAGSFRFCTNRAPECRDIRIDPSIRLGTIRSGTIDQADSVRSGAPGALVMNVLPRNGGQGNCG